MYPCQGWVREEAADILVKLPFPYLLQLGGTEKCGKRQDVVWPWGLGLSGMGIFTGGPRQLSSLVLSVMPYEEQELLGTVASGRRWDSQPTTCRRPGKCQCKAANEQLPRHSCSEGQIAMKTLRMELCNLDREVSVSPAGLWHIGFAALLARRMFFSVAQQTGLQLASGKGKALSHV